MDVPSIPPPGPSGYQPAPGEGLTFVDLEVTGDRGRLTGRYRFPTPRAWSEAQPAIVETLDELARVLADDAPSAPAASAAPPATNSTGRRPAPLRVDGPGATLVDLPAHLPTATRSNP